MTNNFTLTDEVAYDVILNILVNQKMNLGEININIDDLFQESGGYVSKEQIKRVLNQLSEDRKQANQ